MRALVWLAVGSCALLAAVGPSAAPARAPLPPLGFAPPVAAKAADLLVLRRLTLALCGTVPSLEEVRAFEAEAPAGRVGQAVERLLADGRCHRSLAERFARVFVGTHQGAFVVYRRDRLVDWLTEQLAKNRPWDAVVRELVAARGLWTSEPATNFVTSSVVEGEVDPDALVGRTMRAVLADRMDCAQCHDHPFGAATQAQFKGLAAFYAGLEVNGLGLGQRADAGALAKVPYGGQWLPATGAPRERLGAWLTDPRNRRFARATANRVWGLVLGRPLLTPVDDLPLTEGDPLDALAWDFAAHGYDLRRLITVVALSGPAQLSSELPEGADRAALEAQWAVYPLTPLRPDQLVGSLLQAASVRTLDLDSHVVTRLVRFLREKAFVDEYGEAAGDELSPRSGTVGQALLRMNGKLPQELVAAQPFGAVGRILAFAPDDRAAIDALYLAFLTRRPTPAEQAALLPTLEGRAGEERGRAGEDLAWALFNSPEFAWNH